MFATIEPLFNIFAFLTIASGFVLLAKVFTNSLICPFNAATCSVSMNFNGFLAPLTTSTRPVFWAACKVKFLKLPAFWAKLLSIKLIILFSLLATNSNALAAVSLLF